MAHRAGGLVQPGVLKFHGATVTVRVEEKGRNVALLILTDDGERRSYLVEAHPNRLGAVGLTEVKG